MIVDPAPPDLSLDRLAELLRARRVIVLVGAGCSTESGIPDYRGPESLKTGRKPMQYQTFIRGEADRKRYWARSTVGWSRIRRTEPNAAHLALAEMEAAGAVGGLITQNVDGLHQRAGSRRVVELHGALSRVVCLDCGEVGGREEFQERIELLNRHALEEIRLLTAAGRAGSAPDGDADLPLSIYDSFSVPSCSTCGGIIKPDVVFFGENVPPSVVEEAWALYEESDLLLVVGSSLTVYSGRRFIYRAQKDGIPIVVLNQGPTRADEVAVEKVEGRLGRVLPDLAKMLQH